MFAGFKRGEPTACVRDSVRCLPDLVVREPLFPAAMTIRWRHQRVEVCAVATLEVGVALVHHAETRCAPKHAKGQAQRHRGTLHTP